MRYDHEAWEKLISAVEDQGGALLTTPCRPTRIPELSTARNPAETCGCKNESRFSFPRLDSKEEKNEKAEELVTACAVCDDMGKWPRFS